MNRKHLLAAALVFSSISLNAAPAVKAGIDAWQHADYAGAVSIWRPLAEKGDSDAQFNLGQAYRLGRGVPTNLAASKTWFERAARQGHVDAQTTLGLMLFQNGERSEGIKWLKQAAEKGEPRAQLVYGTALVNGDGVPQDPALGYANVSRAAAAGLQPARETLKQLDDVVPLASRKRGAQLAAGIAKQTRAPAAEQAKKVAPTPAKVAAAAPAPAKAAPAAPARNALKPAPPASVAASAPKKEPAPAPQAAPASGAWRIQLGAFSQRGSAEALYQRLAAKFPGRRAFYVPAGAVTRLQIGPFETKAAAQSGCASSGMACFVVPGK